MLNVLQTRLIVVFLLLVSFMPLANAKKVYGIIVTKNNDTIYGTIRISKFNLFQKTVSAFSYNMDDLFDHVYFKSSTDSRFKELFPRDILEYGFILEGVPYRYVSIDVKVKLSHTRRKFFLQIANGDINLFTISLHINNQDKSINPYGMTISEYYILSEDMELIRVSQYDRDETVFDFLMRNLKLNKEVLSSATKGRTFKKIAEIAEIYNNEIKNATIEVP